VSSVHLTDEWFWGARFQFVIPIHRMSVSETYQKRS
jgi:hypothetical protein